MATGAEILLLLMAVVAGCAFQTRIVGIVWVPRPTRGLTRQLLVGDMTGQAGAEGDIARSGVAVTTCAGETQGNMLICKPYGLSGLWLSRCEVRAEKHGRQHHRLDQRPSSGHPYHHGSRGQE